MARQCFSTHRTVRLAHAPQTCAARPSNQRCVAVVFALLVPRVTAKWDVRWKHHEHVASTRRWDVVVVDDVGCADDLRVAPVEVVEAVAEC